jgi:uncharacterized membrane protein YdjX (TVP38/TMEM64 family)
MRREARLLLLIVGIGLVIIASRLLPLTSWLMNAAEWFRTNGIMGAIAFMVVYFVATLLFFPGFLLNMAGGFIYGAIAGSLLIMPANALAGLAAFHIARSVARERFARWAERRPRFAAVDRAVRLAGFRVVLLLRLANVFPFNSLNYVLGLTAVTVRDYIAASVLGMLPITFYFAYVGSLAKNAGELTDAGPTATASVVWPLITIVAGGATIVLVTRLAKRELKQRLGKPKQAVRRVR